MSRTYTEEEVEEIVEQKVNERVLLGKRLKFMAVLLFLGLALTAPALGNIVVDHSGDFVIEEGVKLDMSGDRIVNVSHPTESPDFDNVGNHAATKGWVESYVEQKSNGG